MLEQQPLLIAVWILLLFGLEMAYFQIADRCNIIDKPNQRSSHRTITLRGGGILFPLAWLMGIGFGSYTYWYATLGLVMLATICFWDDVKTIGSKIRFAAQFIALTLCFYQLQLFSLLPWYGMVVTYALCIGVLNAVNFMDGINGITGLYGLSVLIPVWFCNDNQITSPEFLVILALVVFGFFNFRKQAKCFAGDVGSVSLGYIFIFCLIQLIFPTDECVHTNTTTWHFEYILFLGVYGIDSMFTIFQRLWNRENILQPHRKHLYQYLANEVGWPHLRVSLLYASVQAIINVLVMMKYIQGYWAWVVLFALGGLYIFIKRKLHLHYFSSHEKN
jgi:UDP-GlcNAc:undecaprenyl-phosphate GlcNAc-1-phosphate transferase